MIGRDGGLSTLCHSCGLRVCLSEEGVRKTFPGPGYLRSEDGVKHKYIKYINTYI